MTTSASYACPRCGNFLMYGQLACNRCGALVYSDQLNQISQHAMQLERTDPSVAAAVWRQALDLLPPDAQQAQFVRDRVRMLEGGGPETPPVQRNDTWGMALLKTGGSMLLSFLLYALVASGEFGPTMGLVFGAGLVLLILVHELGHSLTMRYYGLSAGPPIFIPFLGAFINLRQQPRNAWEEAVVGIGGPALGTLGAVACHVAYVATGQPMFLFLAWLGYLLNLFNLLPVPPLDGGRIAAAVSPWIWMPGVLGLVWMIIHRWQTTGSPSFILIALLLFGWPRIVATLRRQRRGETSAYYDIGRSAKWKMGAWYAGLGLTLIALFYFSREALRASGMQTML